MSEDAIKEVFSVAREKHRSEAIIEFQQYRSLQIYARNEPHRGTMHIVFDFDETILLPHLLRQPGQLNSVTSMKFAFFGVSIRNVNLTEINCLPEGHRPGDKYAAEF